MYLQHSTISVCVMLMAKIRHCCIFACRLTVSVFNKGSLLGHTNLNLCCSDQKTFLIGLVGRLENCNDSHMIVSYL